MHRIYDFTTVKLKNYPITSQYERMLFVTSFSPLFAWLSFE